MKIFCYRLFVPSCDRSVQVGAVCTPAKRGFLVQMNHHDGVCYVPFCESSQGKTSDVTFHEFPVIEVGEKWIKVISRKSAGNEVWLPNDRSKEEHRFSPGVQQSLTSSDICHQYHPQTQLQDHPQTLCTLSPNLNAQNHLKLHLVTK
ncbi:uncharacterized protein LOC142796439 [Rhipicephalus microplus]|uniref:uncharacterized protein LOC142796439 n=1 Tax=Rhipicephalus microplus TaxID=6941 RepID=UPI003F6CF9E4